MKCFSGDMYLCGGVYLSDLSSYAFSDFFWRYVYICGIVGECVYLKSMYFSDSYICSKENCCEVVF